MYLPHCFLEDHIKNHGLVENALDLIESEAGKHFDPELVPLMRILLLELLAIKRQFSVD